MRIDEALLAACPVRFRPVIMTSLTLVLAMVPAVLDWERVPIPPLWGGNYRGHHHLDGPDVDRDPRALLAGGKPFERL